MAETPTVILPNPQTLPPSPNSVLEAPIVAPGETPPVVAPVEPSTPPGPKHSIVYFEDPELTSIKLETVTTVERDGSVNVVPDQYKGTLNLGKAGAISVHLTTKDLSNLASAVQSML